MKKIIIVGAAFFVAGFMCAFKLTKTKNRHYDDYHIDY